MVNDGDELAQAINAVPAAQQGVAVVGVNLQASDFPTADTAGDQPDEVAAVPVYGALQPKLMAEYKVGLSSVPGADPAQSIEAPNRDGPREQDFNLTLRELVTHSFTSGRLRNVANGQTLFIEWTVAQALARREQFTSAILELPNLGRTTADELLRLLQSANTIRPTDTIADEPDDWLPASRGLPTDVDPRLSELSLSTILCFLGGSARLMNCIGSADLQTLSLADYLAAPARLKTRLSQLKGIGRKTIDEAFRIIEDFMVAATSGDSIVVELLQPRGEPVAIADQDETTHSVAKVREVDSRPVRVRFEEIVSSLAERQRYVLAQRYGIDGVARRTLQEIAEEKHVTRERIRQLEAKALQALRLPRHRRVLVEFLRVERGAIWSALSQDNDLVSESDLREAAKALDPWHALAIEVTHSDVREWIAANATAVGAGWLRTGLDPNRVAETTGLISRIVAGLKLPQPMATIAALSGCLPSAVTLSIEHSTEMELFEGYIVSGRAGTRLRRLIRLHAIACELAGRCAFDLATLVAEYRARFSDDAVAPRIFQMQLDEAPHLFCKLHDSIWFVLGRDVEPVVMTSAPYERRIALEPAFEAGTIGAEIVEQLQAGPRRQVDLRDSVPDAVEGNVASSSVGAVLLSNPCFRRVSPGIFDLCRSGDVGNDPSILNSVFVNERQCHTYCLARYSGAPIDWYPAWGPALEHRLARWARHNAGPDLFGSLMYVIDPSKWSAPDNEMAVWRRSQEQYQSWRIGVPRRFALGRRFLDANQVLPTLAQLAFHGWTSWMAVNRTTDAPIHIQDSADILALLIKAELVIAPDDWQKPHIAHPKATELFIRARTEMHAAGVLGWEHGALAKIWSTLELNPISTSGGWLDDREFAAAVDAWSKGEARSSRAFARRAAEPIDPDPIFKTSDWDNLFSIQA